MLRALCGWCGVTSFLFFLAASVGSTNSRVREESTLGWHLGESMKGRRRLSCAWHQWLHKTVCEPNAPSAKSEGPAPRLVPRSGGGSCGKPDVQVSKKHFLGLGVLVRQEAPFIQEFVEHYISEGVQHFFIVDQETTPKQHGPTAAALAHIVAANPGLITFVQAPELVAQSKAANAMKAFEKQHFTHLSIANIGNMERSFLAIANAARATTTWMVFVDSDEYMYAARFDQNLQTALRAVLRKTPSAGQVSVPWERFGSSGHVKMPRCIVSAFTWRVATKFESGHVPPPDGRPELSPNVKSILRLDALKPGAAPGIHRTVDSKLCPHFVTARQDGKLLNPPEGNTIGGEAIPPGEALLRVNHYFVRLACPLVPPCFEPLFFFADPG